MPFDLHNFIHLDALTSLFLTLFIIGCCTRFITGREFQSALASRASTKTPAIAPYVTPYFGHYVTLCFTDALRWIQQLSHHKPREPFAAHVWGRNFNVMIDQNLLQRILHDHVTSLSFKSIRWYLLVNIFGASRWHRGAFSAADKDAHGCLTVLEKTSEVRVLIHRLVSKIQEEAPTLVSSSRSLVDESPWERSANAKVASGDTSATGEPQAVEVDMFALIRNFVGHLSTSSLVGAGFLEMHPNFLEDLWQFDSKWQYMLLGLPRWLPIPGLPKAYIARRNLHNTITSFHKAVDRNAAGETLEYGWNELEDASALFGDRSTVWRAHKSPTDVKASADLSLLWAANVKPSSLVFWMLFHIFSSPNLVKKIRNQIRPYIAATQPPKVFGIPEPPRLHMQDVEGLVGACPLLRACFYECLRLYSKPMAVREVTKAFSVAGASLEESGKPVGQHFAMRLGTYLVAPLSLHSHNNSFSDSPQLFKPHRLLVVGRDGNQKCDTGVLRPWGLGEAACPGKLLAERQVLVFVAAIVSLWDIEPAGLRGWSVPQQAVYSVVAEPRTDVRVFVRARNLSSGQG